MSSSQENHYSEEEKYANDSFETDVPESSTNPSEGEAGESEETKSGSNQLKKLSRVSEFWTCESSSDDDDVVLGHTIAEINTDPAEFDDEHLSLTPAARLFQLASQRKSAGKTDISDNYELDDLDDCEENGDEIDEIGDIDEDKTLENDVKYKSVDYNEEHMTYETSGIDLNEIYSDVDVDENGVGIDEENPDLYQETCDEENEFTDYDEDEEMRKFIEYEKKCKQRHEKKGNDNAAGAAASANTKSEDDTDGDEITIGAVSTLIDEDNEDIKNEAPNDRKSETKSHEKSSLHTDDSMEEFKRKVLLSERMRYLSDGSGDHAHSHLRARRSSIPVWIGNEGSETASQNSARLHTKSYSHSMATVSRTNIHSSLPNFNEIKDCRDNKHYNEVGDEYACGYSDEYAGGDFNDNISAELKSIYHMKRDDSSSAYSVQMELFMDPNDIPKKPRKLKAGERRNKSFSNERLRDIERHNHILLHKILNQKPTYIMDEKKKKNDKFSSLPPSTRVSSAEVNRKKQQRQIDLDNQTLKRKLEAIAKRKPNIKQN